MYKKLALAMSACAVFGGCTSPPPECSSKDTLGLVKGIITEQLVLKADWIASIGVVNTYEAKLPRVQKDFAADYPGVTPEESKSLKAQALSTWRGFLREYLASTLESDMKIELAAPTEYNDKIRKISCRANLNVLERDSNKVHTHALIFDSQVDEKGQHLVNLRASFVEELSGTVGRNVAILYVDKPGSLPRPIPDQLQTSVISQADSQHVSQLPGKVADDFGKNVLTLLSALEDARRELSSAPNNKGGHQQKAIDLIGAAQEQLKAMAPKGGKHAVSANTLSKVPMKTAMKLLKQVQSGLVSATGSGVDKQRLEKVNQLLADAVSEIQTGIEYAKNSK